MDSKRGVSLSVPSTRPSITLPARSTVENLFTGGGVTGTDESPGPMTLVSNFFSENDPDSDCRSFSQLLSGAMLSPAEIPDRRPVSHGGDGGGGSVDFQFGGNGRPGSLVVSQRDMFTIPPGMSPASLLESPAGFFPQIQVIKILLVIDFKTVFEIVFSYIISFECLDRLQFGQTNKPINYV